jgi:type I restriction enzyme S subunit
MSSATYQQYKESGIGWVEKIPSNWDVLPLYALSTECDEPNKGMLENNLLSLSYGRIINKDINSNDGLLPESFETYQVVQPEDMVLRLTDLQNDKRSLRSAIVRERGIITSAYLAIRPTSIFPEYFAFLLRAYDLTKVFYSMGGGLRQSMKFSDIKRMPILFPSIEEQKSIANFLNHETQKIESLIAEQEKLVELLREKRQVVISSAVTKGLDSNVSLKESGIDWLGMIPKHWGVIPLKYAVSMRSGDQITSENIEPNGEYPVYGGNGLRGYTDRYTHDGHYCLIGRQGALCGNINYAKNKFFASEHAVVVSQILPANVFYLGELLRSMNLGQYSTSAAQPGLSVEVIGNIRIPFPSVEEQDRIADYLANEIYSWDTLMEEATKSIRLLNERQSALISAAVTGQINVRNIEVA